MPDYQILDIETPAGTEAAQGSRPFVVQTNAQGRQVEQVMINTARGLQVNSLLRRDEWQELDNAVVTAARQRLNGVADLQRLGLIRQLGGIGTLVSQWNQASEVGEAAVNMTGQAAQDRGRVDYKLAGVPVPIIFKDYVIPIRQLEASRRLGNAIDTSHAFSASRVVAEALESMLFLGNTVTLNGNQIYGYTNHPQRNTDTAANYGGGDFGTIGNIVSTILGMVAAANAAQYYGPFGLYFANAQYVEMLETYTDGSGQTALQRALSLPMIEFIKPSDFLTATHGVMVQMTPDVIDLAVAQDITNLEWTSGDGMTGNFKVMQVAAPRIKSDYNNNSGIVHVTGA